MARDYDSNGELDSVEWDAQDAGHVPDARAVSVRNDAWDDEEVEDDWDAADYRDTPPPLIIPGGAGMAHPRIPIKRRKSLRSQLFIFTVAACVLLSGLFSVGYVSSVAGANVNPLNALVNIITNSNIKSQYRLYRAQSGDSFDLIAAHFGVQINGIFELNHLYVDARLYIGQIYEIPNDPNYGANYNPPLPSNLSYGSYQQNPLDIPSPNGYQFNAIAGITNAGFKGKPGVCPTGYAGWANGGLDNFHFINPDQPTSGKPASRVTQRFWAGHDGMDLSTGTGGTPLYAVQAGTVIFADYDQGGGGYTIKIGHCDNVSTSYSHMVAGSFRVKLGDNVTQGEEIGLQGESGDAFGFHVHFMVFWRNVPVDPLCAYPNGLDGDSIYSESSGPYNGCPPSLGHNHFP